MKIINKKDRAIDAIEAAHVIAFSPFLFQAVVTLRNLGIFNSIFDSRKSGGLTLDEIAEKINIPVYGVEVLLDIAETSGLVEKDLLGKYQLTKTGYFLTYNESIEANINFTQDVCYRGLYHLEDSIRNGKPEGLKVFGDWHTVYEGLSQLDEKVKESWFRFDHYYSDHAFDEALEILLKRKPRMIFDVGGNTGKFALSCCKKDPDVKVTIFDLPGQLRVAMENAEKEGFGDRISGYEIDWLSENPVMPAGADIIWMSQFLDCFSKEEILKILTISAASMDDSAELYIMETFTDRQDFKHGKFALQATSLYFTAIANGNSKMYKAEDFEELIAAAGLTVTKEIRKVGESHTILICKKS